MLLASLVALWLAAAPSEQPADDAKPTEVETKAPVAAPLEIEAFPIEEPLAPSVAAQKAIQAQLTASPLDVEALMLAMGGAAALADRTGALNASIDAASCRLVATQEATTEAFNFGFRYLRAKPALVSVDMCKGQDQAIQAVH